jgi:hypothetical protein
MRHWGDDDNKLQPLSRKPFKRTPLGQSLQQGYTKTYVKFKIIQTKTIDNKESHRFLVLWLTSVTCQCLNNISKGWTLGSLEARAFTLTLHTRLIFVLISYASFSTIIASDIASPYLLRKCKSFLKTTAYVLIARRRSKCHTDHLLSKVSRTLLPRPMTLLQKR